MLETLRIFSSFEQPPHPSQSKEGKKPRNEPKGIKISKFKVIRILSQIINRHLVPLLGRKNKIGTQRNLPIGPLPVGCRIAISTKLDPTLWRWG